MIGKEQTSALTLAEKFDPNQWTREYREIRFLTPDGKEPVNYKGDLLISSSSQNQTIEFGGMCSVLRPAEVSLYLLTSSSATATLFVNDSFLAEVPLTTGEGERIQPIVKEITAQSEKQAQMKLKLHLTYDPPKGGRGKTAIKTTILLGDISGNWQPTLRQPWVWLQALRAGSFFASAWGVILGVAIVVAAHLRVSSEHYSFRSYAVLTAILIWFAGVVGLPDLAHLPLRSKFRELYWKTRERRKLVQASLAILFLFWGTWAGFIFYCLSVRQYYSYLIQKAIDNERAPELQINDIRRAFSLLPWRREAQILFEKAAYSQRNRGDMSGFRKYVGEFVSHVEVEQTINKILAHPGLPFPLDKAAIAKFSDPVVWYASLLPEAELSEQYPRYQQAIELLGKKNEPEAVLQRMSLAPEFYQQQRILHPKDQQPALFEENDRKLRTSVRELYEFLGKQNYAEVSSSHTYQVACDALATNLLLACRPDHAVLYYQKVIEVRENQQAVTGPLWDRPPQKLFLFHLFTTSDKEAGELIPLEDEAAKNVLIRLKTCPSFKDLFRDKLLKNYSRYKQKDAWFSRTALDEKAVPYVRNTLLNQDWRY